jgi:YegS/Rv2252/BmrU family lipid kinase
MDDPNGGNKRVLVVFNPVAGQAETLDQALHDACEVWRGHGWTVDLQPTEGPGDGTRIAREAAQQGYDIVVAAGGDGTVNEVINGLAGTQVALGALPVGTVNVWVREIGLPLQPRAAAEALVSAHPQQIDLGRAGERYFLLMASVGFDAAVTAEVRSEQKRRLGMFAYIVQGLRVAFRYQGIRARIILDGKPARGRFLMVVLGNSQLYGGLVKMTARAILNDGLLDVCLIKGKSLRSAPLRMFSILTRRYNQDPDIAYHRARKVRIESTQPLEVQVDGDHIGRTPMEFEAVSGALYALMPPQTPPELLRTSVPPRRAGRRLLGWLSRHRRRSVERTTASPEQEPTEHSS